MKTKPLFLKFIFLVACFWIFNAASCDNDGEVVHKLQHPSLQLKTPTPGPTPTPDQPPIDEPPPVDEPPFDPEIDGDNACLDRSSRDVSHMPEERSNAASQPKIVGGRPTDTNKWPWAVAITEPMPDNSSASVLRRFGYR